MEQRCPTRDLRDTSRGMTCHTQSKVPQGLQSQRVICGAYDGEGSLVPMVMVENTTRLVALAADSGKQNLITGAVCVGVGGSFLGAKRQLMLGKHGGAKT